MQIMQETSTPVELGQDFSCMHLRKVCRGDAGAAAGYGALGFHP